LCRDKLGDDRSRNDAKAPTKRSLLRDKERASPRRYGVREGEPMIPANLPVEDVMERWPATIRVFLDLRMRCVGCPIACFHTVTDAAHLHGIEQQALLRALRAAVDAPHRPLPRLRGRDMEGDATSGEQAKSPLPNPPPRAGEGAGGVRG
jgi:hybrid cluster-associated redox disulfide protein